MLDYIKKTWSKLTAIEPTQEMEMKIFNSAALITVIYLKAMIIFNLIFGQYLLSLILLIISAVVLSFYLIGRSRKEFKWGIWTLALISYPILGINFYLNDGIEGPTFYIFLMIHIIILTVVNFRSYWFWAMYNVACFGLLYYIGTFYPSTIPSNYAGPEYRFLDHFITYFACALGTIAIISALKWNYHKQKAKNELKGAALNLANEDLLKSNEQKNKIIALITHDLKNPLISIANILEMINEGELDEKESKRVLKDLFSIATNAHKMTEEVLDWATMELKSNTPNYKRLDFADKCQTVLAIYRSLSEQKKIELSTVFEGNTIITTDIDRLLLIVRNLLQNAIKFTPAGGKISFYFLNNGKEISITISDTGTGITSEKLKGLFEMKFQSTSGTSQEKGTGLGLFICQENAKRIGATLEVQSQLGIGSAFKLSLPLQPADHPRKK